MGLDLQSYYLLGGGSGGGSSDISLKKLSVTRNGTYKSGAGKAYNQVDVNVYSPTKETLNVLENGTYTSEEDTAYTTVNVAVPRTTIQPLSVVQNGTYTAQSGYAYSPVSVNVNLPGLVEDNDVRFFGYGGQLVYSYSAEDFAELSAMPQNPAHPGMTADGWNWTLSDAKAYVAKYGMLDIGQVYTTDDGKTRIYMSIPNDVDPEDRCVTIRWMQSDSNGVEINWGDGSSAETSQYFGTTYIELTHTYANAGDYMITLNVLSGTVSFRGDYDGSGNKFSSIFGRETKRTYVARSWCTKIEFGNNIHSYGQYMITDCINLKTVTISPTTSTPVGFYNIVQGANKLRHLTIPDGITTFDLSGAYDLESISIPATTTSVRLDGCSSLRRVSIPDGATTIGTRAFSGCSRLEYAFIPDTVESIGESAFYDCRSLKSVTIPDNTQIGVSAFYNCKSLVEIVLPAGSSFSNVQTLSSFSGCSSVRELKHNTTYNVIRSECYAGLHSLISMTISSSIAFIYSGAFSELYSIKEMHFLSVTPPQLNRDGLPSNAALPNDCIIYVPAESVDAYKAADVWSNYASRIQAEPTA